MHRGPRLTGLSPTPHTSNIKPLSLHPKTHTVCAYGVDAFMQA